MRDLERRFWPFKPRFSIAFSIALLVGLLLILVVLRFTLKIDWPGKESESAVLLGVMVFSLLPIFLSLIDVIIEWGGIFEAGGVKIDFSRAQKMGASGFTVPVNIGVSEKKVYDSSTTEILDALRKATGCEIAIIDLEEGRAWWETRLLVLLAGAVRLRTPEKVVFIGKDGGSDQCFQGWSHARDLLPHLLQAHPQYPLSYHKAMAAARQWEMVEPKGAGTAPPSPPWMVKGLATQHQWMTFDNNTGLPNTLLAEQLLASDLGAEVEIQEDPKRINLVRLENLFRPVLRKENIDTSWSDERQNRVFFDSDSEYIAISNNKKYATLVSRRKMLNVVVKSLVGEK